MPQNYIELPLWADLHAHFRQGEVMQILANEYHKMGCYAVLAMPNTAPPVAKIHQNDMLNGELEGFLSIEEYKGLVSQAFGGKLQEIIVPLYITRHTTAQMIHNGAESGLLKAAKYYPPHGTTNSDHGVPFAELIGSDILYAMEERGVILCIHGEEHGCVADSYFDKYENAETLFYKDKMPKLLAKHPNLKIVAEHITTKTAVDFVASCSDNVVATITPQHLLYTVGDLLMTKSTHLICMPYVKFAEDRQALREAVLDVNNSKFFAGTDNAPHPKLAKHTDCGCAAGCFVAGIAPQIYAQGFEAAKVDILSDLGKKSFQKFLCDIGVEFYGFAKSDKTFRLIKERSKVSILQTDIGEIVPLPCGLVKDDKRGEVYIDWRVELSNQF